MGKGKACGNNINPTRVLKDNHVLVDKSSLSRKKKVFVGLVASQENRKGVFGLKDLI